MRLIKLIKIRVEKIKTTKNLFDHYLRTNKCMKGNKLSQKIRLNQSMIERNF